MSRLSQFDFWVADYRSWIGYTGVYGIWQYTDQGVIDGIRDRVDLNIAYRDYPSIIKSGGYNRLPAWMRILPGQRGAHPAHRRRLRQQQRADPALCAPAGLYGAQGVRAHGAAELYQSWVRLEDLQLVRGPAV